MQSRSRVNGAGTYVMASLTCLIGVAMVVSTLVRGGGPAAFGVVIGVLFILAGAARLYLLSRR